MKIVSYASRIEGCEVRDEPRAFLDARSLCGGYAASVAFYPTWHHVVIARDKTNPDVMVLISMPSRQWEDSIGDEYEIVQRLSAEKEPS